MDDAVRQRRRRDGVERLGVDLGPGSEKKLEPLLAPTYDPVDARVDRLVDQREQHGQLGLRVAGEKLADA